jgi:hypothetical protein
MNRPCNPSFEFHGTEGWWKMYPHHELFSEEDSLRKKYEKGK